MRRVVTILLLAVLTAHGAADWPRPNLARRLAPERVAEIVTNAPGKVQIPLLTPREWREGRLWRIGDVATYDGGIYYCVQSHTPYTGAGWSPDRVPALWYLVKKVGEVIPEWRQPLGAHDAHQKGDIVMHKGQKWRSLIDNNVWEPGVFGWEIIP